MTSLPALEPDPTKPVPLGPAEITRDAFLGGRVEALQPKARHHRSGLDAVMLAAALPSDTHGHVVDLGSGVGVAGLCAAARLADITATLVERNTQLLALARETLTIAANAGFARRVCVLEADVTARGKMRTRQGLSAGMADHVIVNPPYYDARHRPSPHDERADAHVLAQGGLEPWLRTASDLLVTGGTLTLIFRADALNEILAVTTGRFGAVSIFPLYPHAGENASRIIVRGIRGSKAPMSLRQGIILHENGHPTATAEAILRHGAGLGI